APLVPAGAGPPPRGGGGPVGPANGGSGGAGPPAGVVAPPAARGGAPRAAGAAQGLAPPLLLAPRTQRRQASVLGAAAGAGRLGRHRLSPTRSRPASGRRPALRALPDHLAALVVADRVVAAAPVLVGAIAPVAVKPERRRLAAPSAGDAVAAPADLRRRHRLSPTLSRPAARAPGAGWPGAGWGSCPVPSGSARPWTRPGAGPARA